MLPNNSYDVQSWLKQAMVKSRPARVATGKTWLVKPETFGRVHGAQGFRGGGLQAVRNGREREVFGLQTMARGVLGKDITVDVSQNIDRARARTSGVLPTITP